MTGGSYQQITVPYTITNGTATAGVGKDYTATDTGNPNLGCQYARYY